MVILKSDAIFSLCVPEPSVTHSLTFSYESPFFTFTKKVSLMYINKPNNVFSGKYSIADSKQIIIKMTVMVPKMSHRCN